MMLMRLALALVGLAALAAGCGGGARANSATGPASGPAASTSGPTAPGLPAAAGTTDTERLKQVLADSQYHADLGAVHLNHGKPDAAIAAYKQAVEIGRGINENALHIWALGKAYKTKGDQANWKASLEHAAKLFTQFVADKERARLKDYYCEQLAVLYGELGDPSTAVEWVDQMASEGQPDSTTLRAKARLYIASGLGAKALDVLQQAEQQAQPGIEQDRASYTLAEVLAGMRKYDEAIARLKSLAKDAAEPGLRADAKRLLFRVYDTTGKLDELDLDKSGRE